MVYTWVIFRYESFLLSMAENPLLYLPHGTWTELRSPIIRVEFRLLLSMMDRIKMMDASVPNPQLVRMPSLSPTYGLEIISEETLYVSSASASGNNSSSAGSDCSK